MNEHPRPLMHVLSEHIEVFRGKDRLYYWRWKAGNGEIIAQSEGYTRRWSAKRAARRVAPNVRIHTEP